MSSTVKVSKLKNENEMPRVVVFAASLFAQNVLAYLAQEKHLVGVILPDPSELGGSGGEANKLAHQLQQAAIPFQMCCKAKLPLICQQLNAWGSRLGVVATFPYILPDEILDFYSEPKRAGIFNLHASNLPDYAGPSPVYWQLRDRKTETSMVLHRVEKKVDSGNIVAAQNVAIAPLDTLSSLSNRLAYESAGLTAQLIDSIISSGKPPKDIPQIERANSCVAPRPSIDDYTIHFDSMSAEEISAMCRAGNGLSYGAIITINNVSLNLMQSTPVDFQTFGTKPGTIIFIGEPEGVIVCVKNGALRLDILACVDGIYTGLTFAERFHLDAGSAFDASSLLKKQA